MSTTIYVVMGATGEYSDRFEWAVCAYTKSKDAKAHAAAAELEANKIQRSRFNVIEHKANPHDAKMEMGYMGTDYYVMSVNLRESFFR